MALPTTSGIYRIVYSGDGREYIGSAVNFRRRWLLHLSRLRKGNHHSVHMQRVYDKYGPESLAFEVIENLPIPQGWTKAQIKSRLIPIEQEWLDERQPAMNGNKVAGSMLGYLHTEETKRKIAAASTGRQHTLETKAKISSAKKGRKRKSNGPLSDAHRAAIGDGNRRRVVSDATRAKMRESQLRRFENPDEREKIAAARRGTTASDETKAKMRASSSKGQKKPPEFGENASRRLMGHPVSQETRDRISAAKKAGFAKRRLESEQKAREELDGESSPADEAT